jgi:Glycosyltransferase family 87
MPSFPDDRRVFGAVVVALAICAWLIASLAISLAAPPRCAVGQQEDLGCARGFQQRERTGRRTFRWTDGQATVLLTSAGYGTPLAAELVLAGPRPPNSTPPRVLLDIGRDQFSFSAAPPIRRYRLLLSGGFPKGDVLRVHVRSDTMTPEDDRRALGVMLYEVRALPLDGSRWAGPLPTLALLALGLSGVAIYEAGRKPSLGAAHPTHYNAGRDILIGVAVMLAIATLWVRLPTRVAPFLLAAALLIGGTSVLGCRFWRASAAHIETAKWASGWLILAAILGNAAIDGALASFALPQWWIAPALLAQAALTVLAVGCASRSVSWRRLPLVLCIAVAVRLLGFAARLLTGHGAGAFDRDVDLFYKYGQATLAADLPAIEYPSGALASWAIMALPASRELFRVLLPLFNLCCDLAIVWGIWSLESQVANRKWHGTNHQQSATRDLRTSTSALFYAISPLLLPFWYARYDPLPAALLVLGLVAFAQRRPVWAGAALGLGGAIKWTPWLAAPFLAWDLLRAVDICKRQQPQQAEEHTPRQACKPSAIRGFVLFAGGFLAAILAASLPFAWRDWNAFVSPYVLQSQRRMIAESVWFPIAWLFEPQRLVPMPAPWTDVRSGVISIGFMTGCQVLALAALWLAQAARGPARQRTLALAALAPATFLLLNRIFSPQYLVIITACALAAGCLTLPKRAIRVLIVILVVVQSLNLLVWPNVVHYWLAASVIMFVMAIGMVLWLALDVSIALDRRQTTIDGQQVLITD